MPAIKSVETALSLIKSDNSKILDLTIGTHKVTPGQQIPKAGRSKSIHDNFRILFYCNEYHWKSAADAQAVPELAYNVTAGTYMVIGLDIDAPFPSFGILGPILHWIQPGLEPEQAADGRFVLTSSGTPFVANYIGPAPPPGSAPHRYVFLLYEQPADFDVKNYAPSEGKNLGNWHRMRYDLGAFEKEAKLGPVLASNYFFSN